MLTGSDIGVVDNWIVYTKERKRPKRTRSVYEGMFDGNNGSVKSPGDFGRC